MTKEKFYYPSEDGITKIHASVWLPDGEPKAVLQIIHGMIEYIDRYTPFAEYMASQGFIVCGEDHLGHGESVRSDEYHGYFGREGNKWMMLDIHHLRCEMQRRYPDLPYIMMGHSMGSFLIRQYLTEEDASYADGLKGAIVMGTAWQPAIALKAGKAVSKMLGTEKVGVKSKLLETMAFGTYLKRIPDAQSKVDWLSKDRTIMDKYQVDPYTSFHFTPNGFYHMFAGMEKAHDIKRMQKLPAGLPIHFCAGAEDPVGSWGEGVRKAYTVYTDNTECEVSIKLYLDDRHEILNETDKEQVFADMLEFCNYCLDK